MTSGLVRRFTFQEVARILNNKNLGRNKIFKILRDEGILDQFNCPSPENLENGLFTLKNCPKAINRFLYQIPVPMVVGEKGIAFVRQIVESYIEKNGYPYISKRNTNIHQDGEISINYSFKKTQNLIKSHQSNDGISFR